MTDSPTNHLVFTIPDTLEGARLDKALTTLAPALTRSRAKAMIEAGDVRLNDRPCHVARQIVKASDEISFPAPEVADEKPQGENMPLDILHEDDHVIVIDKPAGLTVHPGAGVTSGTLVNALLHHTRGRLSLKGGEDRPGIVHRLDKETSGVMVIAKTDLAYDSLTAQFADHGRTGPLERAYTALVWGKPFPLSGTIDAPLGRSPRNRVKMAVVSGEDGREAITHYRVAETMEPGPNIIVSLVECQLETGRTHQIRVHFAHIKCPVLGDPVYGTGFATKAHNLDAAAREALIQLGRQALHAHLLVFEHPETGEIMEFESPLPDDFQNLLNSLAG